MQATQHRLAALALSAFFTLTMLVGVDQIATAEPPAALLAQTAPAHAAAPANS
ncbi:hypothetical protein ACPOLB_20805 [Rubrivivax sp. RP6-9]|uniref:hypothetical protein n=1 Tax=Rubrivivax sp. RP6-9 TaxID=3415750 RepID=UPI003CC65E45